MLVSFTISHDLHCGQGESTFLPSIHTEVIKWLSHTITCADPFLTLLGAISSLSPLLHCIPWGIPFYRNSPSKQAIRARLSGAHL